MNAHHFFFARNIETGEVECFATKYIPCTDYKSSKFQFWKINNAFEKREPRKVLSWNHGGTGQDFQLQAALGEKWEVLSFWHTCQAIQKAYSPSKHAAQ